MSENQLTDRPGTPAVVYYLPPQQAYPDDEINLVDYWRVLMVYKWLIVLLTLLAGGLAAYIAMNTPPVYRAEALLAPASEEKAGGMSALAGQFGGLASLAGINLGSGGGGTEQAIATLQSRAFLDRFIADRDLLPVLFADRWDSAAKRWKVEAGGQAPTARDAYGRFKDDLLKIAADKKSGLVTVAIEWGNPAQAAEWVNELVARLNNYRQREAIREAQKSIDYLKRQLAQTSVIEMQQSIFNLIEAQTKSIMLANVREEYAFKVIDPAVAPEKKIRPKRAQIVALGVVAGFFGGIFLAFFRAFLVRQRERTAAQ